MVLSVQKTKHHQLKAQSRSCCGCGQVWILLNKQNIGGFKSIKTVGKHNIEPAT